MLQHCRWLQKHGVGLAVFGTNSEANSMSVSQKVNLLNELLDNGLSPSNMMPGTGACSIDDAVALTLAAVKGNCAGVLMLPPFYYKQVSDEGIFRYFSEVIEKVGDSDLQVYLYNIPPITGIRMSIPLIERLVKTYPRTVVGMKDSSGDWSFTEAVIHRFSSCGFQVYSGTEEFLLSNLQAGGVGCISATANINPKAIADLAATWRTTNADQKQQKLIELRKVFQKYPMIPAMKTVISHYLRDDEWCHVRPPLINLSDAQRNQLLNDLEEISFVVPEMDTEVFAAR